MLDLYSGPNAPLAKAFNWCGWRVVTPVDLERDVEMDVSRPEVRQATVRCLPQTSCMASAMSCATKSRAREKQPGPPPLRSESFHVVCQVCLIKTSSELLRVTSPLTMPLRCNIGAISMGWHASVIFFSSLAERAITAVPVTALLLEAIVTSSAMPRFHQAELNNKGRQNKQQPSKTNNATPTRHKPKTKHLSGN